MRLLICGGREWNNKASIRRAIRSIDLLTDDEPLVIIHGACRGADTDADGVARDLELDVDVYPAQWNKYGRSAGPIRNQQMLDEGKPDLVFAFHSDISESKGTKHMVSISEKAGIPTTIFTE